MIVLGNGKYLLGKYSRPVERRKESRKKEIKIVTKNEE